MRSFKSNENIHKIEGGSYYVVSANKASSVTLPYIEELATYCQNSNHVILMGDFNSRTGLKDDYIGVDHYFTEQFCLECTEDESIEILNKFHINNISLSRKNKDCIVNTF